MALRNALAWFLPPRCVDEYLIKMDFSDGACFTAGLSKALGYGVIAGSSLGSRSAAGLSILSLLLELLTYTTTSAYSLANSYPFSSYGEATFLALQTFIITWLAITWKSQPLGVAFSAVYVAGLAVTFSPVMPLSVLYTLQTLNVPIMLVSKILQIAANWRNGSTGQLSAITLCLFALGSTARIFTSLEETGDNLIILTYILSTLCNYILMGQVFYYWNSSAPSAKKTSKK
ncbi:PQ loop repeat protein [Opisthorchis viverrini]|uniref:Solute carrier family 66 member 3 n=1 Tax=Opisthorchis viverrini TaxID=6198 RepID=A0A1S8X6B6_OPIVI|nr:PQ loop repeat protein [Opisthorchis viverrini]